ncbi:fluoride efflux transporter CrcB [Mesorhizobium sp.]|uniref:fluoride efflux transporter CrcB n=1 Tax=Mesorhizobium sp. TaxID=1871066 RepID=UPI000FE922DD|nr:fluoride efflux transporter CrcB [Mesorhizobium sp.]RWL16973.1 MAG: fluoride efflux transporter CrcB [Mesorhizobium sp.]RWM68065.1 MAG: fluoride efflux transporter CrcB [Mesorhizobium sp.]TIO22154.1 MAG: fluoride efflux transporter CrcB [Mesorhizobium sp.]TJV62014.1 MAG: fluoride efflux transporter CrcB [Mesorhizobium sp.]
MGFFLVFIGSGIGGALRHGVGLLSLRLLGPNFPYGTLGINIVGSGLMGFVVSLFGSFNIGGQDVRLFLTTGIIGGFTTFSTFSLDAVTLWERGQHLAAIGYIFASVALSLTVLMAVLLLVRR